LIYSKPKPKPKPKSHTEGLLDNYKLLYSFAERVSASDNSIPDGQFENSSYVSTKCDTAPDPCRGDVVTFIHPLYVKSNTKLVGADLGDCTIISLGATQVSLNETPDITWLCNVVFTVNGVGSVVVNGPFYENASSLLAVIGGTGKNKSKTRASS
jgi:hypothetical protein